MQEQVKTSSRGLVVTLICMAVGVAALAASVVVGNQMYYLTSVAIAVCTMVPFFASYENRRPQAKELVIIAVMVAIAVVARAAFFWIPFFTPIAGVIIIAGLAFGAQAGFMVGSLSLLVSNFLFGQGAWTPWQMMAYGIGGFVAGLLFHKKRPFPGRPWLSTLALSAVGFLTVMLVVGPLLDTCTVFTTGSRITWKYALAVYAAGFGYNLTHAAATAITIFLVSRPLLEKLDRLKRKYGMMEAN